MSGGRFVIIAQARSGSTLLRYALHAHPDVVCHGEVLSPAWINRLVPRGQKATDQTPRAEVERLMVDRARDINGFMQRHVYGGFSGRTVGFKIVYADLFKPRPLAHAALAYLIARPMTVIHLYRANTLAAFVSRQRMKEFGVSHSNEGAWRDLPYLIIARDELVEYAAEQASFRARTDALFPHALKVRYEDLRDTFPAILRHLGVSPAPFVEGLQKLAPDDLRDVVANYDEVSDFDGHTA